MKQKTRTFVAVEIEPAVRDRVAALVERFQAAGADVKWVRPENMHVTLKFLGDVETSEIHRVCEAVERAVADAPAFDFEVRGAGAFPNANRPRTVWVGTAGGAEALVDLNKRIERALEKLGFRREARRFEPHLTIGRVRRGGPAMAELGKLIREQADAELGMTPVSEVVVFSSELGRSGPTYDALARAPLGEKQ